MGNGPMTLTAILALIASLMLWHAFTEFAKYRQTKERFWLFGACFVFACAIFVIIQAGRVLCGTATQP
jgi:hypothetical protein